MFNHLIQQWFEKAFKQPTAVQSEAWQAIGTGKDVLISAPTGSGKTLAAFLQAIDGLFEASGEGLSVVYVSPLKALSNDINLNLQQPLEAINALGTGPEIRTALWTGDTSAYERERIKKQPPHILVTTPESLYNIITSKAGRAIMPGLRTVIIDEVHALAPNKRGAHLLLTLQRLEALAVHRPQRIAISATQRPIERMQSYILHPEHSMVVNLGHKRDMDLSIELAEAPLTAVMSNEEWSFIYEMLAKQIKSHQTTVVFVNNRRLAERAAKHLAERVGEDLVTAHHGSLARKHRFQAEQALKAGQLKAIVATASLELGIDIGDVDLVCQLGSPGSIQAFLQRVGRSGHGVNRIPKGRIYPLTIDDLLEATAMFRAIEVGQLEHTEFPKQPLDVLAQQIVAEVSQQHWHTKRLYHLFTEASLYQHLSEQQFRQVIQMLAQGYSNRAGFRKALIFHDEVTDELRPRKAAALTAVLNGGTIPDQFDYEVRLMPEDLKIGTLNEDFSFESIPGDIFQLGNHSYRILKIQTGTVFVADAAGQPPNIPFWFGVQMWRSDELSRAVSAAREDLDAVIVQKGGRSEDWPIDDSGWGQLLNYLSKTRDVLSVVPTQREIVVERFFDGNDDMHVVIHSVYGSRVNRAWGLALRKKFCRQFNFELQAAALEDALILSLSSTHSFELKTIECYLQADSVKEVLIQALLDTPFFVTQWRWNASVALAVKRRMGDRRVLPQFQRNDAEDLVAEIFPEQIACAENIAGNRTIPDHPLVEQTLVDCTEGIMDVSGLQAILSQVASGEINMHFVDSHTPSPTSMAIINARNYAFLDETPAEERRTLAVQTRTLDESFKPEQLSDAVISAFNQAAKPEVRDLDELQEYVHYSGVLWPDEAGPFQEGLEQLLAAGRIGGTDQFGEFVYHSKGMTDLLTRIQKTPESLEVDDLEEWVNHRLSIGGLIRFEALHQRIPVAASLLLQTLLQLEVKGVAFQMEKDRWIERHHLSHLRKSQLKQSRSAVTTLSQDAYQAFLNKWQFIDQPAVGVEGLAQVLSQWQGFAATASEWESQVLKPRVQDYHGLMLDMLCQSGQFIWKRAQAKLISDDLNQMTLQKTRFTFLTQPLKHLFPADAVQCQLNDKSRQALAALKERGALFFRELLADMACLPVELEQVLIQLIKNGLVVADGFQALRVFSESPAHRRKQLLKAKKHGNELGYLEMMGRWSLIETAQPEVGTYVQLMLNRHGVLCYDLWQTETTPVPWKQAHYELQRMEARGEILGGRFVAEMSGMQYALAKAYAQMKQLQVKQ